MCIKSFVIYKSALAGSLNNYLNDLKVLWMKGNMEVTGLLKQWSLTFFGTSDRFCGRQFFHVLGVAGGWFRGSASDGELQAKLCSLARCLPPALRPDS